MLRDPNAIIAQWAGLPTEASNVLVPPQVPQVPVAMGPGSPVPNPILPTPPPSPVAAPSESPLLTKVREALGRSDVQRGLAAFARGVAQGGAGTLQPLVTGLANAATVMADSRAASEQAKAEQEAELRKVLLRHALLARLEQMKAARKTEQPPSPGAGLLKVGEALFNPETKEWILPPERKAPVAPRADIREPYQKAGMVYDAEGRLGVVVFDPETGESTFKPIGGGFTRAEDAELKHVSKEEGKQYGRIVELGQQAQEKLPEIDHALKLIEENPDVYFGPGAEGYQWLKTALAAAGLGDLAEEVATGDVLRGIFLNRAMERIAATKGAISDREMVLFERAAPSLSKSRLSNIELLRLSRDLAQRQLQRARFIRRMVNEKRMPVYAAEEAWQAALEELPPILTEERLKRLVVPGGEDSPSAAPARVLSPEDEAFLDRLLTEEKQGPVSP